MDLISRIWESKQSASKYWYSSSSLCNLFLPLDACDGSERVFRFRTIRCYDGGHIWYDLPQAIVIVVMVLHPTIYCPGSTFQHGPSVLIARSQTIDGYVVWPVDANRIALCLWLAEALIVWNLRVSILLKFSVSLLLNKSNKCKQLISSYCCNF